MRHTPLPEASGLDTTRFFEVDEVDEPSELVKFLDVAKALPGIKAAKADILERLQPERASAALDVGCGYGADVIELAKRMKPGGQAIGIDISETMIAVANRRARVVDAEVTFQTGDALALPFEDNAFDICRTETVLQHLADPQRAVIEMARVTRPSGRVAALEFDLGTLFIDHPDAELLETMRSELLRGSVQASMGRQLPRLFVTAGLERVTPAPRVILSDPSFFRLALGHPLDQLRAAGVLTAERVADWWATIEDADTRGHFTGGATALVVSGTVR